MNPDFQKWLLTTAQGVILLGAVGSILAVCALRFTGYLVLEFLPERYKRTRLAFFKILMRYTFEAGQVEGHLDAQTRLHGDFTQRFGYYFYNLSRVIIAATDDVQRG